MTSMKRTFIVGCMMLSAAAWAAENAWQGPSIVGSFYTYSRAQPASKMTGKIHLSKDGLRSEIPMPAGSMITILNGKAGKCWYADDNKKIFMEATLNRKTGDCPSFMGEAMDASADKSPTDAVPCEGYAKKSSLGGATVAGRAVEKWSCSNGQGLSDATQWYDPKLRLMLKEETSDGEVMEFQELREMSFAAGLLEMPKGMKQVSAEEFRNKIFGGMLPPGIPSR